MAPWWTAISFRVCDQTHERLDSKLFHWNTADLLDFNKNIYFYFGRICRFHVSIRLYRLWWTDTLDNVRFIFNPPSRYGSKCHRYTYVCHNDNIIFQLCFRCLQIRYDKEYDFFSFVRLFLLWRSHSNHAICNGREVRVRNRSHEFIVASQTRMRNWGMCKINIINLLTSDALVATELMLGDNADSGLAFKPYGYRAWKYDGCCCWLDSDGRYGGKLMLDSTLAVVEPLLLFPSPIDEDEPAIIFVEDEEIAFRCKRKWK